MASSRRVDPAAGTPADEDGQSDWERRRREGDGWRANLRRKPGGALLLKVGALVLGGLCIALGLVLVVLPGPLTIPPVLLGLIIIASEFEWANRLLDRAKAAAREAWEQAKDKPVRSGLVTGGGLVLAGVVIWAVLHYDLIDRARSAVGL